MDVLEHDTILFITLVLEFLIKTLTGFRSHALIFLLLTAGALADEKAVIVVVREDPGHHELESSIRDRVVRDVGENPQAGIRATVYVSPGDLNVKGAWTLLPLFPK